MTTRKHLAAFSPLALLLACEQPPLVAAQRFDISDLPGVVAGISLHDEELHVLAGNAIVIVSKAGIEKRRIELAATEVRYNDIAALGDDHYVLIADNAGYRFDAVTGAVAEHFCVEPGFEEPGQEPGEPLPSEPIRTQRNDAVVVIGDTILAAPRFFADDAALPYESSLRSYNLNDGTPTGSIDLTTSAVQFAGIAVVGDDVVGVSDVGLQQFPRQGGVFTTTSLALTSPAGIASDGASLFVVDEAGTVHILPL